MFDLLTLFTNTYDNSISLLSTAFTKMTSRLTQWEVAAVGRDSDGGEAEINNYRVLQTAVAGKSQVRHLTIVVMMWNPDNSDGVDEDRDHGATNKKDRVGRCTMSKLGETSTMTCRSATKKVKQLLICSVQSNNSTLPHRRLLLVTQIAV